MEEAEENVRPISYSQAYPMLSLLLPIFLKIEAAPAHCRLKMRK